MASKAWENTYADKVVSARDALSHIKNGQTIFVGSGAGEPMLLTARLAEMSALFCDIEVIHLATAREEPRLAAPELSGS
jgi:acyl-CoA hydrolase